MEEIQISSFYIKNIFHKYLQTVLNFGIGCNRFL